MKIARIILLLIVLGVAAGLGRWIVYARHSHELAGRVFGGREAFRTFCSSSVIEAQRLHCKNPEGSEALADYTREAAVRLSEEQARELKRVFSDRTLYSPELWAMPAGEREVTLCKPHYGLLFTTYSVPRVEIAICLVCDQFAVFIGEGDKTRYVNDSDRLAFMRPSLVALAKSIYPNDPETQSLKPER